MPTDPDIHDIHAETLATGLTLTLDFLSQPEEQALLAEFSQSTHRQNFTTGQRSSIWRYGDDRAYKNYVISPTIPANLQALGARLVAQGLLDVEPNHVTVNEYLQGQTISAHIDAPKAGPVITVLSLGVPATMVFALPSTNTRRSVILPPRSLAQMRGDLRFIWTHEILPVPGTRYSLVFRGNAGL
jgi:alkylated DNA repair dioxygenase AlkB